MREVYTKKPKMALFDYGNTLIAELGYSHINGTKAVMGHCIFNPKNLSAEEVEIEAGRIAAETSELGRSLGLDIPFLNWQRLLNETLGLKFDISGPEFEKAYWDGAGPCAKMPYIDEALNFLTENNIRMAVVSNIGFSEAALRERVTGMIPEANFEFFIASSEYSPRKPSKLLYRLACAKAGLEPSEVWFLGDNAIGDVDGPSEFGMFAAWYQDKAYENPFALNPGIKPIYPHILLNDWRELKGKCAELWGE